MGTHRIRLIIIDDNQRLTSAWQRLVGMQPDIELVGVLERADGLVAAVRDRAADVVLMDLTMEGRDPLDALAEVVRECPGVRTLVYSAQSRSEWGERTRRAGAMDFLDKADDPNLVLDAIRRAVRSPVEPR
jgi:DNA-binding NarL/FixJ family response regulator